MEFKVIVSSGMLPDNQFSDEVNKVWSEKKEIDYEGIRSYFDELTKNIKIDEAISDWNLLISVTIGGAMDTSEIAFNKRGIVYPTDKEKEVGIRIPLPTTDDVEWGISDKRRFLKYSKRTSDKGFTLIPVDYKQFKTMSAYLDYSIKLSLSKLFAGGITLKGSKIKSN